MASWITTDMPRCRWGRGGAASPTTPGSAGRRRGGDVKGELERDGHAPVPMGQMEDGKSHDLRIVWNAGARQLDVHYDGVERITLERDLVAEVLAGNTTAWDG